ncbi:MAG: hypothetical protein JSV98_03810 [candidate division WOR-3 bacterium]|nr:MAG: hypothetical protein JSV98_03810 [candidate division WOR-3 bacterium]
MKLIEEIKKAEEKGEILKKNAASGGQALIEKARKAGEEELTALDEWREKELKTALDKAQKNIDSEVKKIDAEHEKTLKKINELYKKNKDITIKKIQEIILKWPYSR